MQRPLLTDPAAPAGGRLATAGLCLILAGTWLFLHPYRGIVHDARLYTFMGLEHLRPDLFAHDIFVRYGSQDQYTLFSPLYAGFIRWLGMEPAAAALTFVSQAAFMAAAWKLARPFYASSALALLSMGLLIALPGDYGTSNILHVVEDFVQPRLAAEALVLAALYFDHRGARLTAVALCLLAALIHPIMAAAGIAFLAWTHVAIARPRLTLVAALTATLLLVLAAQLPQSLQLRFDGPWLALVLAHAPYLALSHWSYDAWSETSVHVATLIIGAMILPDATARRWCTTAIAVGGAGLALTAIGGDWLHLVLIVQAQPWRWLWLTTTMTMVFLPLVAHRLWQLGVAGRGCLALILAAYSLQSAADALPLTVLMIGYAWVAINPAPRIGLALQQLMSRGAWVIFIGAAIWAVAETIFAWHTTYAVALSTSTDNIVRSYMFRGVIPLVAMLAVCLGRYCRLHARISWLPFAGGTLICALGAPTASRAWTQVAYGSRLRQEFAPWRAHIVPGADVLTLDDPLLAWFLLDRPSYLSQAQSATALFSRNAAMATKLRTDELSQWLRHKRYSIWLNEPTGGTPPPAPTLAQLCSASSVRYIVSREFLGAGALTLPRDVPPPYRGLKLYSCNHA